MVLKRQSLQSIFNTLDLSKTIKPKTHYTSNIFKHYEQI